MKEVSQNMKNKKEKDINELITDMSEINKQGFNVFKLNRNLKQKGFETIKFEDTLNFLNNNETVKEPSNNLTKLLQDRVALI